MCSFEIDRKKVVSIVPFQSLQPALQCSFASSVVKKLNALGDFANRDHTDIQIVVCNFINRLADVSIAIGFAYLGQNACIQKHSHRLKNFTRLSNASNLLGQSAKSSSAS